MMAQSARKDAASMGPSGATVTSLLQLRSEFGTKHLLDGMNSRAGHVNSGLAHHSTSSRRVSGLTSSYVTRDRDCSASARQENRLILVLSGRSFCQGALRLAV